MVSFLFQVDNGRKLFNMIKGDRVGEEKSKLDELIEKEFEKYGFKSFDKERINMESFDTIMTSIKNLVGKEIGKALFCIIRKAQISLRENEIEIRENTVVTADQFRDCILLNRDPEIKKIRIKVHFDPEEKEAWYFTELEIESQSILWIKGKYCNPDNAPNNAENIGISTYKKALKTFQIILREAEKIK